MLLVHVFMAQRHNRVTTNLKLDTSFLQDGPFLFIRFPTTQAIPHLHVIRQSKTETGY
jgi:hypothetical protein